MDTKLIVSASPHVRSDETTQSLMANVIVALCPCVVASAIIFGVRALLVTAVSVVACVAFEWLYCKLLKRANPISDLSAVVTGIILAMNVPVGMPIGQLIIGDLVAIIVVKQLFGGIGMNFANPALVGRIVLFISFAGSMNKWVFPDAAVDQLSKATPLAVADPSKLSLLDLFMGIHGGVLGETCALAIVLGLIYLVATKTISIAIPASYVGSVFVFYLIATKDLHSALVAVLSGGKVLASLGVKRGLVAYGQEKLDEISPNGPTTICELRDGYYRTSVIKPEDFGLTPGTKEDLVGGTPEVNAQITRDVLSGKIQGTKRNAVLMNSGAAFFVAGKADSIADGIQLAASLIDSGKATAALEKCIAVSNE